MTQCQLTGDEPTVRQVLQHDDGLPQLVSVVLDQILEAQVTEQLQADRYQRTEERLRTTNSLERLNQEFRRRQRVIRIFPNRDSAIRLIGAVLMKQDELW